MAAAKISIADSGIDLDEVNKKRFGVLIGSGVGGLEAVEESCRRNSKPCANGEGVVGRRRSCVDGGGREKALLLRSHVRPRPAPFPANPPSPQPPPPPPPPHTP
jgi:hypothetical protein